jgi:hypothetical protein
MSDLGKRTHRSREMSTECPSTNACGTTSHVWLKLDDGKDVLNTGNVTVDACVSWSFGTPSDPFSSSDCCLFTLPVKIRNCNDFNVYYLGPTQACPIAYCLSQPSVSATKADVYELKPPKLSAFESSGKTFVECRTNCLECE